jgi:hypothetical protein
MPNLVDTQEFKTLTGIGDLYPDPEIERITQAASNVILAYLIKDDEDGDPIDYEEVPEVVEATTAIAVDMWQSRLAPGGQIQAVDFTPGPYRMGRSLLTRVSGLLGKHMDTGSFVG